MKTTHLILPSCVKVKTNSCICEVGRLLIDAQACQSTSRCPFCNKRSRRIHSEYFRTLADLPVSGNLVSIKLISRKYFCDNISCPQKIFTERFSNEIVPYGRRLARSTELISRLAVDLGGNKGAIISEIVGCKVSPSTILRTIRSFLDIEQTTTSGIIGIDDWAYKKGRTYGTIVVDLVSNSVVDLLPDRQAETVSNWIKEHPEVKIVSRDRSGEYAKGISKGAPQAIQVADRFHLTKNLCDATSRVFHTKSKVLKEVFQIYNNIQTKNTTTIASKIKHETTSTHTPEISPKKSYIFDKVKELEGQGYSIRAIAQSLNISRRTVRSYSNIKELQIRKGHSITNFDSFIPFLLQEGNRSKSSTELFEIIRNNGFTGKYTQFCERRNSLYAGNGISKEVVNCKVNQYCSWSPTKLSFLIYSDKEKIGIEDNRFLDLLFTHCPEIKQIEVLVKQFKELFKSKTPGSLTRWIENAQQAENNVIRNFAKNISRGYEAVNNAVITQYSNGQVEGQVNRLKTIKRMMYGRASFQLLRKMVLSKSVLIHQN